MDADFLLIDNVDAFVSEDTRDIKSNNHVKWGKKFKQVHFVGSFFLLFYAYSYQKYSAGHAIVKVKKSQCFLAHLYYTRTPGERNSKIAKIVKTPLHKHDLLLSGSIDVLSDAGIWH